MANKQKQFDIQFKKDAVKFCEEHPDMTHTECAANLVLETARLLVGSGNTKTTIMKYSFAVPVTSAVILKKKTPDCEEN